MTLLTCYVQFKFKNRGCAATYKLFICVDNFFFLSLSIVKKRQKMCFFMISQKCKLSVWSLYSSVSQSQCQFVFFFSFSLSKPCFVLYCSISDWTFAYGLNMCVQGGDVKVSTGRCFIFFNEIYYAYLYPYMSFVFVVVERKHFIGWRNLKKKKKWKKESWLPVSVC